MNPRWLGNIVNTLCLYLLDGPDSMDFNIFCIFITSLQTWEESTRLPPAKLSNVAWETTSQRSFDVKAGCLAAGVAWAHAIPGILSYFFVLTLHLPATRWNMTLEFLPTSKLLASQMHNQKSLHLCYEPHNRCGHRIPVNFTTLGFVTYSKYLSVST